MTKLINRIISELISLVVLSILLCPTSPFSGFTASFLGDGTLSYRHQFFQQFSRTYDNGSQVTLSLNVSTTELVNVTRLSEAALDFTKSYTLTVHTAFQTWDNRSYFPTQYGLGFYNAQGERVQTSATLAFDVRTIVNDGVRTLAHNPFGATAVALVLFYNTTVLPELSYELFKLGGVGSFTNVFNANASTWIIGDAFTDHDDTSWEVLSSGSFQTYSTWLLNRTKIIVLGSPTEFFYTREYEQRSGLFVRERYKYVSDFFQHLEFTTLTSPLTLVESSGVPGFPIPGFQSLSLLSFLLLAFFVWVHRRRSQPP